MDRCVMVLAPYGAADEETVRARYRAAREDRDKQARRAVEAGQALERGAN